MRKTTKIPNWAGGEVARDRAIKDHRISQLEAQVKSLSNPASSDARSEDSDARFRVIEEAKRVAQARCRELERRQEELEGQVTMLVDRGARFKKAAETAEAKNAPLIVDIDQMQLEFENNRQELVEENKKISTLKSELNTFNEKLEEKIKEETERLRKENVVSWGTIENENAEQLKFLRAEWQTCQAELSIVEKKICQVEKVADLLPLVKERNQKRSALVAVNSRLIQQLKKNEEAFVLLIEALRPYLRGPLDEMEKAYELKMEQSFAARRTEHQAYIGMEAARKQMELNPKHEQETEWMMKANEEMIKQAELTKKEEEACVAFETLMSLKKQCRKARKVWQKAQKKADKADASDKDKESLALMPGSL